MVERSFVSSLPSLRTGLRHQKLDDELLVYDPRDERIHLLNAPTAAVFEMVEQRVTRDAIVTRLEEIHGSRRGSPLLALALDELAKARLIESDDGPVKGIPEVSRRQMIQRLGVGALVLIPAISSLVPSAAYAISGCGISCPNGNAGLCTTPGCTCCSKGKNGNIINTCTTETGSPNCF